MHLHCPHCARQIEEDGINLVKTIALCKSCDNIFDFTRQMSEAQLPVPYRRVTQIPRKVHLTEYTDGLEISVRWRDAGAYCTAAFGLFWTGFIAIFTFGSIFAVADGAFPWPVFLVLIPFWVIGVLMLYSSAVQLFTTTTVSADAEFLAVEHRPLRPLNTQDQYYRPEEVQQLYVKKRVRRGKNSTTVTFRVHAQLATGQDVVLVEGLDDEDAARYIEQRIETYLQIPNRPVAGEHRPVRV